GEAVLDHRLAVMGFARLHQDDAAGRAAVDGAAAAELLHALQRHADQYLVMEMRVIGMGMEPRLHRLGAALRIAGEIQPVFPVGHHDDGRSLAQRAAASNRKDAYRTTPQAMRPPPPPSGCGSSA